MNEEEFEKLINGYHQPKNRSKKKPSKQERIMYMYFDHSITDEEYDNMINNPSFSKRYLEV